MPLIMETNYPQIRFGLFKIMNFKNGKLINNFGIIYPINQRLSGIVQLTERLKISIGECLKMLEYGLLLLLLNPYRSVCITY